MMHLERRLFTAVAAALVLAACGSDHAQDGDVTALGESIQSARLEGARHQDAIMNASTLTVLPAETDRHDQAMGGIMDAMSTRMGGMMSRCSGSGMGMMHDRMDALTSEMGSDRDAMTGAATLTDARNECTAHTHLVDGVLDEMQQSLGNMGCMMGR